MEYCSAFQQFGICKFGINCPKKHDYVNTKTNLGVALNILMGRMTDIENALLKINKNVRSIIVEKNASGKKHHVTIDDPKKPIRELELRFCNVEQTLTKLIESQRSGGLPLHSDQIRFESSNVVQGFRFNDKISERINEREKTASKLSYIKSNASHKKSLSDTDTRKKTKITNSKGGNEVNHSEGEELEKSKLETFTQALRNKFLTPKAGPRLENPITPQQFQELIDKSKGSDDSNAEEEIVSDSVEEDDKKLRSNVKSPSEDSSLEDDLGRFQYIKGTDIEPSEKLDEND